MLIGHCHSEVIDFVDDSAESGDDLSDSDPGSPSTSASTSRTAGSASADTGRNFYKFSIEEMKAINEKFQKGWSFNTIQHQHKKLKHQKDLYRQAGANFILLIY
jgi:hypothetical protein